MQKTDLTGPPVAVVGAGPAGIAAAYYLNRLGHPVTILEGLQVSGGMIGVGIPPYRQPRDVLQREVDIIRDLGVELKFGNDLARISQSRICSIRDSRRSFSESDLTDPSLLDSKEKTKALKVSFPAV